MRMKRTFEIISKDYYSNCLIEAVRSKLRNWDNVKITYVSPFDNVIFCPHILWSDSKYDYDFGNEKDYKGIRNWLFYKGHIRRRPLGFNNKYEMVCEEWRNKHDMHS